MIMKKILNIAILAMATYSIMAQETYENAKIATEDLNGTARYVGMGGAMDALGADISTISSNPAGLGLFRKSSANISVGMKGQQDASNWGGGKSSHISFDQIGFVWANQISSTDFVNFAFNYHMSRDFNYILSVADRLPVDDNGDPNTSQNRVTYEKQMEGLLYPWKSGAGNIPDFGYNPSYMCNQLDQAYMEQTDLVWDGSSMGYYGATDYLMNRATKGYIGSYDFALSGNVQDMFYWGVTLGFKDVHYSHYGEYRENYKTFGNYFLRVEDDRSITGTGFDMKFGVIFRPIEESPFRFGVSIATPTWYDLTTRNSTSIVSSESERVPCENFDHKFKLNTPWKFGLSAGHTFDNYLALGIGYEYADYSSLDTRYGDDYDAYDYSGSTSDAAMNRHTERTLRGVSTLKVGAEYRPIPELAFRMGYNYVSPMYQNNAFKDTSVESSGTSVGTTTDFTNWDSTNRLSFGIGYQMGQWNLSATYLYTVQKGTFEPFYYESLDNPDYYFEANKVNLTHKRNHFQLTLGYTF